MISAGLIESIFVCLGFLLVALAILFNFKSLVCSNTTRWLKTASSITDQLKLLSPQIITHGIQAENSNTVMPPQNNEVSNEQTVFEGKRIASSVPHIATEKMNRSDHGYKRMDEVSKKLQLRALFNSNIRRYHSIIALIWQPKFLTKQQVKFSLDNSSHAINLLVGFIVGISCLSIGTTLLLDSTGFSSGLFGISVFSLVVVVTLNLILLHRSFQSQLNQINQLEKIENTSCWHSKLISTSRILPNQMEGIENKEEKNEIPMIPRDNSANTQRVQASSTLIADGVPLSGNKHPIEKTSRISQRECAEVSSRSIDCKEETSIRINELIPCQSLQENMNKEKIHSFLDGSIQSTNISTEGLCILAFIVLSSVGYVLLNASHSVGAMLICWIGVIATDACFVRPVVCVSIAVVSLIRCRQYQYQGVYFEEQNQKVMWEISEMQVVLKNQIKDKIEVQQGVQENRIPTDIMQITVNKIKQSIKKLTSPTNREVPSTLPFKHLAFSQVYMPQENGDFGTQRGLNANSFAQPSHTGRLHLVRNQKGECLTGGDIYEESTEGLQDQRICEEVKERQFSTIQVPSSIHPQKSSEKKKLPKLNIPALRLSQNKKLAAGLNNKLCTDRTMIGTGRDSAVSTIPCDESVESNIDSTRIDQVNISYQFIFYLMKNGDFLFEIVYQQQCFDFMIWKNKNSKFGMSICDITSRTRPGSMKGRNKSSRSQVSRSKDFNISVDQQNSEFNNRNRVTLEANISLQDADARKEDISHANDGRNDQLHVFQQQNSSMHGGCDISNVVDISQQEIPFIKHDDEISIYPINSDNVNHSVNNQYNQYEEQQNSIVLRESLPNRSETTQDINKDKVNSSSGVLRQKSAKQNQKRRTSAQLNGVAEVLDAKLESTIIPGEAGTDLQKYMIEGRYHKRRLQVANTQSSSDPIAAISTGINGQTQITSSQYLDSNFNTRTGCTGGPVSTRNQKELQAFFIVDGSEQEGDNLKIAGLESDQLSPAERNTRKQQKKTALSPIPPSEQKDCQESTPQNKYFYRRGTNYRKDGDMEPTEFNPSSDWRATQLNDITEEFDISKKDSSSGIQNPESLMQTRPVFIQKSNARSSQLLIEGKENLINVSRSQGGGQEPLSPNSMKSTFRTAAKHSLGNKQLSSKSSVKRKEYEMPQPYLEHLPSVKIPKVDKKCDSGRRSSRDIGNKMLGVIDIYGFELVRTDKQQPDIAQKNQSKSVNANLLLRESYEDDSSHCNRSSLGDISNLAIQQNKKKPSTATTEHSIRLAQKPPINHSGSRNFLPKRAMQNNLINIDSSFANDISGMGEKRDRSIFPFDFEAQSNISSVRHIPQSSAASSSALSFLNE